MSDSATLRPLQRFIIALRTCTYDLYPGYPDTRTYVRGQHIGRHSNDNEGTVVFAALARCCCPYIPVQL